MTTPPVFPSLPGLGWSVTKSPRFATRTQKSVSGRQLRIADQANPIWTFTVTVPLLRDAHDSRAGAGIGPGIGYDELRSLAGFFLAVQGGFGNFLFDDPSDDTVTAQPIATGDGATRTFALGRTFGAGGFFEPLLAVNAAKPLNLYLNGVLQSPSSWSLGSSLGYIGIGDTVTFTAAPAAGVAVTADLSYWFLCHFTADNVDFENFMYQLWQAKQVKFESVLL